MGDLTVEDILGPPPAGIDLSENRAPRDNAVVLTLCVLAAITVILRFIVRLRGPKPRPELDDWLIVAALLLLVGLLVASVIVGEWGMGKHIWVVEVDKLIEGKKILFAWLLVYIFELFLIKASVLMFYRRIFGMNWMIWACLALSGAWLVGSLIALLVCPKPISYFWTETTDPTGGSYRYDFQKYYIGNAAANVVSDILILIVPFPIVWRLKMRITQKIMVSTVLLLGIVVCVASIVRLHYITFLGSVDITWTMSNVYVWSDVEPSLGIICACLPAIQPLVRSVMKIETLFCIHKRKNTVKSEPDTYMSNNHQLHKRHSNQSTASSKIAPVNSLDGKGDMGYPDYDDEMRLTTVVTHIDAEQSRRQRANLEELVGPGFIRVQHEFEISVE